MSFAGSEALQRAVFGALGADAALGALVGDAIYDAVPSGALPPLYVRLGEEAVRDVSDGSGAVALHRFEVSVVAQEAGFATAKQVGAAICDALVDAPLVLARGRLVSLRFERARARRTDAGRLREIRLRFVARVDDE